MDMGSFFIYIYNSFLKKVTLKANVLKILS